MKRVDDFAERGSGVGAGTLSVLVVYEDLETGLRASEALDRTVQRLEAPVDLQVDFWRSDLFCEPAFHQQVARQKADIVFLSAHGQTQLPPTVNSWFREWLGRRVLEPRALAVLLDDNAEDTSAATTMVEELSAAAQRAGVDVFLPAADAETEAGMNSGSRAQTPVS
ncbi:MAG TPA: hypothetical protein VL361_27285 [Candidatus Limnocylindrales bacterium]|nr:hypothetical protein [Candidatus Limnocylindrales bacterium]